MGQVIPIDSLDTEAAQERVFEEESQAAEIHALRRRSTQHLNPWLEEAVECYDLVAGRQWTADELSEFEKKDRVPVIFNRTEPVIDSVSGYEVNNRQEVTYLPRGTGKPPEGPDMLTEAAKWVRDQCDAGDEESDAFRDMLICGIGWTYTKLDYEDDPDGSIKILRVDPTKMRWDTNARRRNLSDMRWCQCISRMKLAEIIALWPDRKEEIESSGREGSGSEDDLWDDSVELSETNEAYNSANKHTAFDREATVNIYHHNWYEVERMWRVLDPMSGNIIDMDDKRYKVAKAMLEAQGQELKAAPVPRRKYFHAYIVGNVILEKGLAPSQEGFMYNPITGRRDRNKNVWYGLVRPMKDPQKWANKFMSQLHHIIGSNANGGLLAEKDAFDNVRKAEEEWASGDSITWVNTGMIDKVVPKPAAPFPAGPERLMEHAISAIRDVTGVNLEVLGLVDRNQPGYVEAQRTKAGLTILANLFASLALYRKQQGRTLAELIRNYLADGRMIRIYGPLGEQTLPLVKDKMFAKYDTVVDVGAVTRDIKEKAFPIIVNLVQFAMSAGMPVPPEVFDYAPLPAALSSKWKQMIVEKMSKPDPHAERMKEANVAEKEAKVKQTETAAVLNVAKAKEAMEGENGLPPELEMEQHQAEMKQKYFSTILENSLDMINKRQEMQMEMMQKRMEMQMEAQQRLFDSKLQALVELAKPQPVPTAGTGDGKPGEGATKVQEPAIDPNKLVEMLGGFEQMLGGFAGNLDSVFSNIEQRFGTLEEQINSPAEHEIVRDSKGDIARVRSTRKRKERR